MASLSAVRAGLATRLATISGLRVSSFQPDDVQTPMAVIMPDSVEYDLASSRGLDRINLTVRVIVGRAVERTAQAQLDGYVFGAGSVKAAIEADRTLGGVVQDCRVTEMRDYGQEVYGSSVYLAATFAVEVVS